MKKRASIRDVAKAAGVSIATVSYVLKGIGKVSEPTIKRVWEVVNELNYTPNPYVQKVFGKDPADRENTGFLMRVSYWPSQCPVELEIEKTILYSFETACREYDYLGANYLYRHEKGFHCKQIVNGLVDGVLLGTAHEEIIKGVCNRVPAVLVDMNIEPEELGLPVVTMDEFSGFVQVLNKIKSLGLSGNMAVVTGISHNQRDEFNREWRTKGMLDAAEKCGVQILPEHCFSVETSSETSDEDMKRLAAKLKTMIHKNGVRIIGTADLAVSALVCELQKCGFRLPEDVVIVTPNMSTTETPGVVTLVSDYFNLIGKAVEVLDGHIKGIVTENKKYLIPVPEIDFSGLALKK